jgi:hypothetical protein
VQGPDAAFEVYKDRALRTRSSSSILSQHYLARSLWSHNALSTLLGPTLLVGLTAVKNPSYPIDLKPESSSIYHSGFDALKCLRQR